MQDKNAPSNVETLLFNLSQTVAYQQPFQLQQIHNESKPNFAAFIFIQLVEHLFIQ